MKNILLIGPPGAGKGTISRLFKEKLNYDIIATGIIFRNHLKYKTKIGVEFIHYINQGQLAPDETVNKMIDQEFEDFLKKNKNPKNNVIIWDGYPRNIKQAQYLDNLLDINKLKLDLVLWIDVRLDVVIKRVVNRLGCNKCHKVFNKIYNPPINNSCNDCGGRLHQREDDKPEIVKNRFNEYIEETKPLLDFYNKRKIIKIINGDDNIENIFSITKELVING